MSDATSRAAVLVVGPTASLVLLLVVSHGVCHTRCRMLERLEKLAIGCRAKQYTRGGGVRWIRKSNNNNNGDRTLSAGASSATGFFSY
jgi:hypothetical protein